ncbi:LacI family DNA-binding transcriptional regulator [Cyclobacterium plantarum]|uniref:LacI family DNA-binding transcriptional regulator n=1 Tax=Cyclobacterium plantarum TaxID=2716263 RepID=UPI003F6E4646
MRKKEKITIHDIALEVGVTASTVSRALNNHPRISATTKKMVLDAAKAINYKPNRIAAALRHGKSKLIGIIVPTINRNFFSSIVRGIEEHANALDYKVMISQFYDDYKKEVATIEALLDARVDGIMVSLGKNTHNFNHFESVLQKGIPLVFFDRTTDKLNVNQVIINDYLSAYQATNHLIEQGYRHIAHFTSHMKIRIYQERLRGYEQALLDNGINFDPRLVVESNMQLDGGQKSTHRLLDNNLGFDAIFSASDYAIVGALQELKRINVKIPQEVGLVGFSNEPFTAFTEPTLSTVDQKAIDMGQSAAALFFEMVNADQRNKPKVKKVLDANLIIRASSKRLQ